MICYFRKSLKSSIKVEMEQQDWESMNFEEIMQRAVNAEVKAGLKSSTIIQDLDIRYPRSHRSSNSTTSKVQTKEITTKDSHPEEPKVKKTRSTSFQTEACEPFKQARQEKKNKRHQKRRDKEQTPASTTIAMEV